MRRTLATMLTMTTYGTWLRGDKRGWVEDGIVYPLNPLLESKDRLRLKYAEFRFAPHELATVGQAIGDSLVERYRQRIYSLTVRTWHVHIIVGASKFPISALVKCAKDAVRYALRPSRPIWTAGYDKRFCFNIASVRTRVAYVERHNTEHGLPPKPWSFIVPFDP